MKIEPLAGRRRPPARPLYLITPGKNLLGVDGPDGYDLLGGDQVDRFLAGLEGADVYTDAPMPRLRFCTTTVKGWTAHAWRGAISSMSWGSLRVRGLRNALGQFRDQYGDLDAFMGWARLRGVGAAGLGTMGWNLFRSTLPREIWLASDPAVTSVALYGGRQQARLGPKGEPRTYRRAVSYDLSAAYPSAMVEHPYPATLREVAGPVNLADTAGGIARATVAIPGDLDHGPLPERLAGITIWPTEGTLEGTWPITDLLVAAGLGCHVRVERAWVPAGHVRPFDAWYDLMTEGRALPGGAGRIAKVVSNLLWGKFAMDGAPSTHKWETGEADELATLEQKPPPRKKALPNAYARHIACETTARVRVKLLEAMLDAGTVYHADTDGFICPADAPAPELLDGPGHWRVKHDMIRLEVKAPQIYRYTCAGCDLEHVRWHYVAAGIRDDYVREWWKQEVRGFGLMARFGDQAVPVNPFAVQRQRMVLEKAAAEAALEPPAWAWEAGEELSAGMRARLAVGAL